MQKRIKDAMVYAKSLGASYADIRAKDINCEHIKVENGCLSFIKTTHTKGFGIRVYTDGAMGFAAAAGDGKLNETVDKAYKTALATKSLLKDKVVLSKKNPVESKYTTPFEIDPFTVPLPDKINLLMECDTIMRGTDGVSKTEAGMMFRKEDVVFADTDGSYIEQSFIQSGGNIRAVSLSSNDMQKRSYNNYLRAGYEAILGLNLKERASAAAKECAELINAAECPSGVFDLVISPRQLFLQIHESVGHPTELDRVFGSEAAFAGTSFVSTDYLSQPLKYGSEYVSIVADAHSEGGLGTFAYDDEGTPAQCVTLVDKGIFKGFLSSRDNASRINQESHGMGLADGWRNLPIVRMTNINLLPGEFTPEELIKDIKDGFYLDENKSWSIDDKRINFQFACEIAREIKNGKLTGRIFKNPIYSGRTTEFWGSCDGVCGDPFWELTGVTNCGKGQPLQIMRVAHGSAPARFRNVRVGVADVK